MEDGTGRNILREEVKDVYCKKSRSRQTVYANSDIFIHFLLHSPYFDRFINGGFAMNELPETYGRFLPTNPYPYDTHRWRVWEALSRNGHITTFELHHRLHVDPTRVNEVRHELPEGYMMPDAVRIEEGNYLYRVVRMEDGA